MIEFANFLRNRKKSEWISEAQEKGFLALQSYLTNRKGRLTNQNTVWEAFAFLIQKDHESQEWFVNLMGDHVSRLEDLLKQHADLLSDHRQLIQKNETQILKLTDRIGVLEGELAKAKKSEVKSDKKKQGAN